MSYARDIAGALHGLAGSVNPHGDHTKDQHGFEASRRTELLKLIAVNCELNSNDFELLVDALVKNDRLTTVLATVIEDFCRLCIEEKGSI